MDTTKSGLVLLGYFAFLFAGVLLAFSPIVISMRRKGPYTRRVIAIDLLVGWTGIGWVVAFGLSFARGDQSGSLRPYVGGCALLFVFLVAYEVCNFFWFHVPAY